MTKEYHPFLNEKYPQPIRNCLNEFKKSWKEFDQISKINENWNKIIGSELSRECRPLKIEQKILIIGVNHPQWRQALIYNKHIIKSNINNKLSIYLDQIKITQSYENRRSADMEDAKLTWQNHPSRIKSSDLVTCKLCNCPSPKGEISRWGQCTFCWRKNK